MSAAYLNLTEATVAYPNIYDDDKTEVTLWGAENWGTISGAAAWLRGPDAYRDILLLITESGMHWDEGPYKAAVLATIDDMEEWEEHGAAYDKWCQGVPDMDDLHAPSLYTEWNQATGESNFIGADQLQKNMKIPKYTPEMLLQRDTLNWFYNFKWNTPFTAGDTMTTVVPDTIELLELTAVGDNHGVAKCDFGAVFVPKSALNHLTYNGGAEVGTIFDGEITFTPGNKFPWRLVRDGVKFTYEDLCGTRPDDY